MRFSAFKDEAVIVHDHRQKEPEGYRFNIQNSLLNLNTYCNVHVSG